MIQAALQAKAVNPNIQLTEGLGANVRYNVTAQDMYRDASDIGNLVDGSCMNLVGSSAAQMTLDFFQMIAGNAAVTRHTSVLFAGAGSALGTAQPSGSTASAINLSQVGTTTTFLSTGTVPGGTTLPAGAYEFQNWTGSGTGTATVDLNFGYCLDATCSQKTPIGQSGHPWQAVISPDGHGAAVPGGALTTSSPTALRAGGTYHLTGACKCCRLAALACFTEPNRPRPTWPPPSCST